MKTIVTKTLRRSYLTCVLFLFAFALFNFPFEYVEIAKSPTLYSLFFEDGVLGLSSTRQVQYPIEVPRLFRGGAPFTYYESSVLSGRSAITNIDWLRLCLNLAIWTILLVCAIAYESRTRLTADSEKRKRGILLGDILILTGIIAFAFAYWRVLDGRAEAAKEYANRIGATGGAAIRSVKVPALVKGYIPDIVQEILLRVTHARVVNPNKDFLRQTLSNSYLEKLELVEASWEPGTLQQLENRALLSGVAVRTSTLSAEDLQSLINNPAIQRMELTGCTFAGSQLSGLANLPRLTMLDLSWSTCGYADVPDAALNQIELLYVTQAGEAVAPTLELANLPKLAVFGFHHHEEETKDQLVSLTFANLPKLEQLYLGSVQLYDLTISQTPNLRFIYGDATGWLDDVGIPPPTRLRDLRIESQTQLENLAIYGEPSRNFSIRENSELKFGIALSAEYTDENSANFMNFQGMNFGGGSVGENPIPLSVRQGWISNLANCQDLRQIDHSAIPLEGTDLSPLGKLKSLRTLDLNFTNLTLEQIQDFPKIEGLEELHLMGAIIDGKTTESLLRKLPNLKRLKIDSRFATRLRLENFPLLETIFEYQPSPSGSMDAVRLVNLPNFRDAIELPPNLVYAHIEGTPNLEGITFSAPLPERTFLDDLSGLKYFSGGGKRFTELFVSEVLSAKGIQRLTLAFCSAEAEAFQEIDELLTLQELVLTGSNVNDETVLSWDLTKLESLRLLRLDHTKVTTAAIPHLMKAPNLQYLSLNGCDLSELTPVHMGQLKKLWRLGIAGAPIAPQHFKSFREFENLRWLDIGGCDISKELATMMAANVPANFNTFLLTDATIGQAALSTLIKAKQGLFFELTDTNTDYNLIDRLIARNQISQIVLEDRPTQGFMYRHSEWDHNTLAPEHGGYFRGEMNPFLYSEKHLKQQNSTY